MDNLEMRSLLVVDDDEDQIELLKATLAPIGVDIICVYDGTEALEVLSDRKVDAVLTDYRMPEMTGIELIVAMKDVAVDTPAIIYTGYHDMHIALDALRLGAIDFLHKPASSKEIVDTVVRAIEIGQRRRMLNRTYEKLFLRTEGEQLPNETDVKHQRRMISLLQLKSWSTRSKTG